MEQAKQENSMKSLGSSAWLFLRPTFTRYYFIIPSAVNIITYATAFFWSINKLLMALRSQITIKISLLMKNGQFNTHKIPLLVTAKLFRHQ
jgi:hypothetical protein